MSMLQKDFHRRSAGATNGATSSPIVYDESSDSMLESDATISAEHNKLTFNEDSKADATLAVPLGLAGVGVLAVAMMTASLHQFPHVLDLCVLFCCLSIVAVTGVGMWGNVEGGGMPVLNWFAWHPVLMTSSFPCLMVLGRWSYLTPSPLGEKAERRQIHRALMSLAILVMLVGYYGIFKAHLAKQAFFGYNFSSHEWAAWQRVVHANLGYLTIILCICQAVMGMSKYNTLQLTGDKTFTFHGTLGKSIVALASLTLLMAVWFWPWGQWVKVLMVMLILLTASFGTVCPKMNDA